jgi:subtilisin family serine protease
MRQIKLTACARRRTLCGLPVVNLQSPTAGVFLLTDRIMSILRYPIAILAALLLAPAAAIAGASQDSGKTLYIVSFDDAPVASFRGLPDGVQVKGRILKATSPAASGRARLDMQSAEVRSYRDYLAGQRAERLAMAGQRLGRALQPEIVYEVASNAVAVLLGADEAAMLAGMPGVAAVEAETRQHLHSDSGPAWIGAEVVWNGPAGLASRGAGRVIGVVDSGINRAHPSFAAVGPVDGHVHGNPRGRLFGLCTSNAGLCNTKLIGIYDFTVCSGETNYSGCTDEEANDGSDADGHGSHVASTAAGNLLETAASRFGGGDGMLRLSGVAPHANVISYKACEKWCPDSWTLAAIDQAVADGVDVINYSIGGDPVDPWGNSVARAMLAARDANVVVVSSAGNSGPRARTVGIPANAPWVLAVANSSHDRSISNRLLDLSGGASPPPAAGVLHGAGQTPGLGPRPLVVPQDFPGCSSGSDLDFPPTGVSNPWPAGRFNGEIVVCLRGTQARVAKSHNVALAGGGGMVLLNTAADGESTVADEHGIPSTHLGYSDGQALLAWLASGSGHQGRIEGARVVSDPAAADRLANSSSRGPVAAGDFMKPAVAAPGSSVLAAGGSGSDLTFKSGTSMASPHVAGAALLLRALRPHWTVADIESALLTTAVPAVRVGGRPASAMEQGAGRIDVAAAARAGLSFPVSRIEFEQASSGSGRGLNQPAVIHGRCFEQCSITRRVRDIAGGGRWRVEAEAVDGLAVQVSPQEFTLAAGATQTLQVTMQIGSPALLGQWAEGALRLRRIDGTEGTVATTRIPVAAFASPGNLPARIDLNAAADRGHVDLQLGGLAALADLRVIPSTPAAPQAVSRRLVQDPDRNEPFSSIGSGSFVQYLQVPANSSGRRFRLIAEASSSAARHLGLFVGLDFDGNGLADESEQLCRERVSGARERCELDFDGADLEQTLWVLVQNRQSASSGSVDAVNLDLLLVDLAPSATLEMVGTGPSTVAAGAALPLRLAWNMPALLPNVQRTSLLQLAIGDQPPFAAIPLQITRSAAQGLAARVLAPGTAAAVSLAAGSAHEQLVIDVPANASALVLRTQATGSIDLYAAHVATPAGPAIVPAPPRAQAQASAVGGSGNKTLRIEGSQLQAGRWYVTPVNSGAAAAAFTVSATLEYGAARVPLAPGAYFNPDRSGAGAFLYEIGDAWGFIWYTYLQDGTPTWYLGATPAPGAERGVWRVPLDRYVWNGSEAIPTRVGEAILGFSEPDAFQFGWNLDGQSGSERYVRLDTGSCPQHGGVALDASGIWYSPDRPGFGYSVNTGTGIETHAAYLYDAGGIARWLFGSVAPFGAASIPMQAHFGACPLCPYQAPTTQAAGMLTRSYASGGASGRISTQFSLPAPLGGSWQIDLPAVRMTDAVGCNP